MIYKIKIKGLKELEEKFGRLEGADFRMRLKRTMRISAGFVKTRARQIVPVDTGSLRRSITEDISYSNNRIIGIIEPKEPYGAAIEFGTKPHFVPVGALKRWANKRGINPYALAVSISRKGTKKHPFMFPAFRQTKNRVIKEFKNLIDYLLK